MVNTRKKPKQDLFESDSENEMTEFPRFIVTGSLEETPLAKVSAFLIEKIISSRANPRTVKKTRSNNLQKSIKFNQNGNFPQLEMQILCA